jgi:hypothetical protein
MFTQKSCAERKEKVLESSRKQLDANQINRSVRLYSIGCSSATLQNQECMNEKLKIQIKSTNKMQHFHKFILDDYVWLNMFRAPLRPLPGEYNCTRSLWFYRWSVVGRGLQQHAPTVKPEALSAVVRS